MCIKPPTQVAIFSFKILSSTVPGILISTDTISYFFLWVKINVNFIFRIPKVKLYSFWRSLYLWVVLNPLIILRVEPEARVYSYYFFHIVRRRTIPGVSSKIDAYSFFLIWFQVHINLIIIIPEIQLNTFRGGLGNWIVLHPLKASRIKPPTWMINFLNYFGFIIDGCAVPRVIV